MDLEKYKNEFDCPTCGKGKLILKQVSNQTRALYSCNHFESDGEGNIEKCEQTIWLENFNKFLTPNQIKKLVETGSTEYIKFKSKKGNDFSAKIEIDTESQNTKIHFEERKEEVFSNVNCPACSSQIFKNRAYYCEGFKDKTCLVYIPESIASFPINDDLAKTLLDGKSSDIIHNFKSKEGESFSSRLYLDEDTLKVKFDNTICQCPKKDCTGTIIGYQKVFKCSENRKDDTNSCDFVVFRNIAGGHIDTKLFLELMENGRSPEPLHLTSKKGKGFQAHLIYSSDGKITFEFVN